jgi:hypothetical protein
MAFPEKPTFEEALGHKIWFGLMMEESKQTFTSENLHFLKVAEKLLGGSWLYNRYKLDRVLNKYVKAGGERQVNLSSENREALMNKEKGALQAAVNEVKSLVRFDSYQRFLTSKFAEHAVELTKEAEAKSEAVKNGLDDIGIV